MSVTEQDIAKAIEVLWPLARYRQPRDDEWDDVTRGQRDRIAQALAKERERARAPFLALAEEYGRVANDSFAAGHRDKGYDALEHAAEIRRAAEENQ